jgi:ATP-dependent 26S proteasome regulatory subunit
METHLEQLLRAQTPFIWVFSPEEDRTATRILSVATRIKRPVFEWDCIHGFQQLSSEPLRQPGDGHCIHVTQALQAIGEYRQAAVVFVVRDLNLLVDRIERQVDYVQLVRQLRQLYRTLSTVGTTITILSSSAEIPIELRDSVTLCEALLPSADDRLAVIQAWLKANAQSIPCVLSEEDIYHLVAVSAGMTSRQIQRAIALSVIRRKRIGSEMIDDLLTEKVAVVRASGALEYIRVEETLADVGGSAGIKQYLQKRAHAFGPAAARYGLPQPKGVLFAGIAGTGKSLLAKVSANVLHVPLLKLDVGKLQGSLVGQSEERMRNALALAESQAPCVVWIDEIEKAFGGVMGPSGDSGVAQRQFGYLLNWMQERRSPVFLVATANHIQQLPPEFLRKGRFDEIFFIDVPTSVERKAILEALLRKHSQNPQGLTPHALIDKLDRYTGAEIDAVIVEAMFEAFDDKQRPLTAADLEMACTRIVPLADQMRDEIERLRRWGKTHARPASE